MDYFNLPLGFLKETLGINLIDLKNITQGGDNMAGRIVPERVFLEELVHDFLG